MKTIIFLILLSSCSPRVVHVIDGDTLVIKGGEKIRLAGIDCPELSQPYGLEAKDKTVSLCLYKKVRIEKSGLDKYGRILAFVYVGDLSLNKTLLESGLAWHYARYDNSTDLSKIEFKARFYKIGMWKVNNIEPYKYRMNH